MSPCLAFPLATKPALCQCGVCRMEKLSWKYIRASRGEAGRKTRLKFACEKGDTNLSLTRDLPKQPLPWSHNPGGSGSTGVRAAHGAPSGACSRGLASCRRGLCPGTTRRDAGEPQGLYTCCGTPRGTGCSPGQSFWQQCVPYTAPRLPITGGISTTQGFSHMSGRRALWVPFVWWSRHQTGPQACLVAMWHAQGRGLGTSSHWAGHVRPVEKAHGAERPASRLSVCRHFQKLPYFLSPLLHHRSH